MMLGVKKSVKTNEEWWIAWDSASTVVPDHELESLVDATLSEMELVLGGKTFGCGWSGGKDAQAVAWLAHQLDSEAPSVLSTHGLHFPAMVEFHRENLPVNCAVIDTGQDVDWLIKHPERLFAPSNIHARTMQEANQTGQDRGFKQGGWDVLVTGRRSIDGNYTGPAGKHFYSNARGITRYSPIHAWSHEAVFALLQRQGITLAPCYSYPNGFRNGTEGWAFLDGPATTRDKLDEIHAIDPTILPTAARVPVIGEYLESLNS